MSRSRPWLHEIGRFHATNHRSMRVSLTQREHASELSAYFRGRGFLVVDRGVNELDVHPMNHVSARSDSIEVSRVLGEWRLLYPTHVIDEPI